MKVLVVFLIIVMWIVYFFGTSGNIFLTDSQPDTVNYDAEYELQIKEGTRKLVLFDFARLAQIDISRKGSEFSYRHGIDIKFLGSDVSKTKVEWLEAGISLQFDSGHNLFIPRSAFEGGR